MITRATTTAGFYGKAISDHHVTFPPLEIGALSAGVFSGCYYGVSHKKSNEAQEVEPLECDTRSFLKK